MAKMLDNLMGRNDPAKKLQKEIENTMFRKQSIISPLQNEIAAARRKIDQVKFQIGDQVYAAQVAGLDVFAGLKEYFEEINLQNNFIAEREAKIKEFSDRYDEELAMLRSSLSMAFPPRPGLLPPQPIPAVVPTPIAPAAPAASGLCTGCGGAYNPGIDIFCTNCGQRTE